jgi:hypothetical protein
MKGAGSISLYDPSRVPWSSRWVRERVRDGQSCAATAGAPNIHARAGAPNIHARGAPAADDTRGDTRARRGPAQTCTLCAHSRTIGEPGPPVPEPAQACTPCARSRTSAAPGRPVSEPAGAFRRTELSLRVAPAPPTASDAPEQRLRSRAWPEDHASSPERVAGAPSSPPSVSLAGLASRPRGRTACPASVSARRRAAGLHASCSGPGLSSRRRERKPVRCDRSAFPGEPPLASPPSGASRIRVRANRRRGEPLRAQPSPTSAASRVRDRANRRSSERERFPASSSPPSPSRDPVRATRRLFRDP